MLNLGHWNCEEVWIEGKGRVPFRQVHSFAALEHHIRPLCLAFACCELQSQCMQAESQYHRHTFTPSWCDTRRHKLHFLIYIGRRCKWALCWTCVLLPACLRRLFFEHDNFFLLGNRAHYSQFYGGPEMHNTTQRHPPSSEPVDMLLRISHTL